MTNEDKRTFFAEQARALATIILTRRGDLTIVESKRDTGLDFHVYVDREDKPMRLTFGILLRAVPSSQTATQANKVLIPTMGQFLGMKKFTYPVCLFFFTLRDEQGYFCWLAEPTVMNGTPKLVHHAKAKCVELTDDVLNEAIEQVVGWYDAVEPVLIA